MKKIYVCKKTELLSNNHYIFNIHKNEQVVIFQLNNSFYAVENRCPHAGAYIHDGEIEDHIITCIWHGWQFDLKTGKCLNDPWVRLQTYPLEIVQDEIYLVIED
jgi:nitrite reductase/ring-hydroxylating ferredoxin subunit